MSLKIIKYCGNVDGDIHFLFELHDNKNIPIIWYNWIQLHFPWSFGKCLILHVYIPNISLLQIWDPSMACPKKNLNCFTGLTAGLLEDVPRAQNAETHLDNHKGLQNLWVTLHIFFFWYWTRNWAWEWEYFK